MAKKILIYVYLLLIIQVPLMAEMPDWSVESSHFEFSMSTTSVVWLDETEVSDTDAVLGAFVNDECRGVASPVYNENYDRYFLYMTIFSNTYGGEKITFRYYDAQADQVTDLASKVDFSEGEHMGSAQQPYVFSNTQQYCEIIFNITDQNEDAIENAIVTLNNDSGEPGDYQFLHVAPGTLAWSVEKQGYLPKTGELQIEEGTSKITLNVMLSQNNVGVAETTPNPLSIYPNPAQDHLGFKFSGQLEIDRIRIFDICGKQVWKSENTFSRQGTIEIQQLPAGVYFINFETSDNNQHLQKFVRK